METALTGPSIIIAVIISIISNNVNITSLLLETTVSPMRVFSGQPIFHVFTGDAVGGVGFSSLSAGL